MSLQGRIVLVTGAASGIGEATALHLAELGARVIAADLDGEGAERVAERIGPEALACRLDVTEPAAVEEAVAWAATRWGPIDIAVNSAGVLLNRPFLELASEDFGRVLAVNLLGSFHVGQAVARGMIGRGGRIINIASVAALRGYPGRAAYAASKGGVISLTHVMALELARHRILVNAVAPGPVETPMTGQSYDADFRSRVTRSVPLGRMAAPQELARVIAFLASAAADYVTGQVIVADGGMSSAGFIP